MAKTLMILGHPTITQSIANSTIVSRVQKTLQNIEIRNLAELYPDYKIDVLAEQEALVAADIIVFQFPFHWYGAPAILQKYFEDVYAYQFAYGSQGDKLKGKQMQLSFTTGASEADYTPIGIENYRLPEFLKPLEQIAYYTGMEYLDPIFSQSMMYIPGIMGVKEEIINNAELHATKLITKIAETEKSLLKNA